MPFSEFMRDLPGTADKISRTTERRMDPREMVEESMPKFREQGAARIRAAVAELNAALRDAAKAGLHVELELADYDSFGQPHCDQYEAKIERRERL